jgi:eukaryotic-like serine/threonine-protein kinase
VTDVGRFVAELRRRRVFRVAAAYAVVGWVIVQAAAIMVPHLLLPEGLVRAVIVVVLLGFPLALLLAWAYDLTPDGIRATPPRDPAPAPAQEPAPGAARAGTPEGSAGARPSNPVATGDPTRWRGPTVAAVVLGLLLAGGTAGFWLLQSGPAALTDEELIARIEELASEERFVEAFELLESSGAQREALPPRLLAEVTDRLTVITDPGGAQVLAARFVPAGSDRTASIEWRDLGTTPVRGLLLARGDYLLRIERGGHAPAERIASTAAAREGVTPEDVPETVLQLRLVPDDQVPEGMVFVPGGPYAIASRNLQGQLADLQDFFMDRFPVTNARYAEFVGSGGYLDPRYWETASGVEPAPSPAGRAQVFVDRTSLPGPRQWSGQNFPVGRDDHPVTGISWFEAAAYCRFRSARLPTFFEWEKTARDGQIAYREGVYLPWGPVGPGRTAAGRANFSGEGTSPVDLHPFGVSPFGAYDMAGNVKEWVSNRTESGRAVTGGSWEDPIYLFTEVGSMDPHASSPSLGFRCARGADGAPGTASSQGAGPLRVAVEAPTYEVVDEATFRILLSHYAYDRRPVEGEILERVEAVGWRRERIRYPGPGDTDVLGYLYLPTAAEPPYQTLVFVPGSDAFFGVTVADAAEWLLAPVIRSGRALFTIAMDGMTERSWPAGTRAPAPNTVRFRDLMVRHATELRMGMDYLEARDDVDAQALAYVGSSWGAGSRLVFAAVDERFRAAILVGAGIDERVQPTLPEASNIAFAPHIGVPKLVLNGREDEEHPWLTRALPLWNLLAEPKELVLVDGAGHIPPLESRIPAMLDFLDRTLGPVRR